MKPQFAMHAVIWLLVGVTACTIHPPRRELLNGQLIIEGVPKIPIEILDELRPYQNSRSAQFLGWLDEGILISTRFANTAQLHRVAQPLGMRRQVTFEGEPVSSASLSPDPSAGGFVYSRDTSGSEFYQLYWFDLATAESRLLTDGESRYTDVAWAPSGRRFAYTTTERNGTDWDLHIQDLSGRKAVALEDRGVGWIALDWTPDEKRLLATQFKSMAQGTLHEVDLETGLVTNLLDSELDMAIDLACYDGTGDAVFFASDMGAEFKRLHRLDLTTGDIDLVTGDIPWDVEEFDVSPDGDKLAMVINEDGYSRLYVVRTKDLGFIALPEIPTGVIYQVAFAPDSSRVGFVLNRPTAPADVFSIDFEARKLTRWTQSELGGLVARNIVEPELFRYRSFDGRDIPAFIYRPNARPPYPVLVRIHGGPEGQARPRFSYRNQFYANQLGVALIAPNVRGSTGYGKTYLGLDDGELREDSVADIGALLDWIENERDLDGSRVAVMGGSYGGYMVLASLVHYGGKLRAGVESVGITNFVTFLQNTQGYRQDLRRIEYGDERDPEVRRFLESISPLNAAEAISDPLLISQGFNDPRVPASESEQLVEALKARGVPVWYVLAMNEGHGFRRKINVDFLAAVTAHFLRMYLVD